MDLLLASGCPFNCDFVKGLSEKLNWLDWTLIAAFIGLIMTITFISMRKASKNTQEFFLSGRSMPWWLLGFSLVATTFAADTPNLVTQLVREQGVSGNWCWWAFLPAGLTTVFIYAALWRRLGVMTDLEFYEKRYSGASAAFVRGFRTVYLGMLVNILIMGNVTLAVLKIFGVTLGIPDWVTAIVAGTITVIFSATGGFGAVLWADFVLFIISMTGAVAAAVVAVQHVGGLQPLFTHPAVVDKLSVLPDMSDPSIVITVLLIPLLVQWWGAWYPGAEPGGGSYTAQHMLSAKDENNAIGATFFFNICHYAVRPWPWILVALASLIVFPTVADIQATLSSGTLSPELIKNDMAYPAMITLLPHGIFGLVVASLFAAYMSTVATHLNLGSSYMVNDFYKRFINKNASEKNMVLVGRIWIVIQIVLASFVALNLKSALTAFEIIVMIGAGTGAIFLLRWFWWRINAWSEIAAMSIAFPVAVYFKIFHLPLCQKFFPLLDEAGNVVVKDGVAQILPSLQFSLVPGYQLVMSVIIVTIGWITVTLLTKPCDQETLRAFAEKSQAGGPGWKHVYEVAEKEGAPIPTTGEKWPVPMGLLCSLLGCYAIYATLFATGYWLYMRFMKAIILTIIALFNGIALLIAWKHMPKNSSSFQKVQTNVESTDAE